MPSPNIVRDIRVLIQNRLLPFIPGNLCYNPLMSQDESTKLFTYMSQRFDSIEKTLEPKADKNDIGHVLGLVDTHEKRIEILEDEKLAVGHQLDRHERWASELAHKINYRLSA